MQTRSIIIFTISGDLHASAVSDHLVELGIIPKIIFTDEMSTRHRVNYSLAGALNFRAADNSEVCLDENSVIWWRRYAREQKNITFEAEEYTKMVAIDWDTLFQSLEFISPKSTWVNRPVHTRLSSNKVYQLQMAESLGFKTPKTLVSNESHEIKKFIRKNEKTIIKPLTSNIDTPIFTEIICEEDVVEKQAKIAPVLLQEMINAKYHLRINVFGDFVYTFIISSNEMDWRPSIASLELTTSFPEVEKFSKSFLASMGLRMGILDFIVDQNDEVVFLENNPQGQFLFLQAYSDYPIAESFAKFLIHEVDKKV